MRPSSRRPEEFAHPSYTYLQSNEVHCRFHCTRAHSLAATTCSCIYIDEL
jgi:hypothetical protein